MEERGRRAPLLKTACRVVPNGGALVSDIGQARLVRLRPRLHAAAAMCTSFRFNLREHHGQADAVQCASAAPSASAGVVSSHQSHQHGGAGLSRRRPCFAVHMHCCRCRAEQPAHRQRLLREVLVGARHLAAGLREEVALPRPPHRHDRVARHPVPRQHRAVAILPQRSRPLRLSGAHSHKLRRSSSLQHLLHSTFRCWLTQYSKTDVSTIASTTRCN